MIGGSGDACQLDSVFGIWYHEVAILEIVHTYLFGSVFLQLFPGDDLKSRFSQRMAFAVLKIRGIHQGFLRFLPCICPCTAKNSSISLVSDTSEWIL